MACLCLSFRAVERGNRLIAAALVLSALSACSDDPRAGTLPTTSPSPATTPPSITPTASPASSQSRVEQAVRAYYAALEAAVHDPQHEIERLDATLEPACACRAIVDVLRKEASRGRRADYALTVEALTVVDAGDSGGTARVTVVQSRGQLYDRNGRVIQKITPVTSTYFVEVRAAAGAWRIARVIEK